MALALAAIRALAGHRFWPDSVSLADPACGHASSLTTHAKVTDSYLLALARANQGKLATLDHKLAVDAVTDGASALQLI